MKEISKKEYNWLLNNYEYARSIGNCRLCGVGIDKYVNKKTDEVLLVQTFSLGFSLGGISKIKKYTKKQYQDFMRDFDKKYDPHDQLNGAQYLNTMLRILF